MSLDVTLYYESPEHEVYSANITHILNKMADAAGYYRYIWRPEELWEHPLAKYLIPHLRACVRELIENPKKYRQFDSPNGWGRYEDFVLWLVRYWQACCEHPEALVRVSR